MPPVSFFLFFTCQMSLNWCTREVAQLPLLTRTNGWSPYPVWALGEGGKKSKAQEVDPALEAHTIKNLFFSSGGSA